MVNKSVLISGVGIAGPTLAYWLEARGFRPTLIEQSPRPRAGGYVIDFWGRGYDIAERMGLLADIAREGYQVQEVRFVDRRGRRVGGFGVDVFRKITGGRYVSVARSALAELLYRTIESRCEVVFDDSVAGIEEHDGGVTVSFERASARTFDMVVGADGLHSVVRRIAFGAQNSFEKYLGYVVAAFEIEGYRPRDEDVYVSYTLPGKQIARFAMQDDRTMILLVFAATHPSSVDPHDMQAQKAILHREYDGAGWECRQMLAALDRCEALYFDRVSQIRMETWSRGRVALVGDAAFCPSLLAGQGAALAMTASYVLAGELAKAGGCHETAFRHYESVLRSFIAEKQNAAKQFAGSFAPKTGLGLYLRNQISKALSLPFVAKLVVGRGVVDRLALPAYPSPSTWEGREQHSLSDPRTGS